MESGEYSGHRIHALFTTEELARAHADRLEAEGVHDTAWGEMWVFDEEPARLRRYTMGTRLYLRNDGTAAHVWCWDETLYEVDAPDDRSPKDYSPATRDGRPFDLESDEVVVIGFDPDECRKLLDQLVAQVKAQRTEIA